MNNSGINGTPSSLVLEGNMFSSLLNDWYDGTINRYSKNIIRYSRIKGFEALVTKHGDNRVWIRIGGREWLLDEQGMRVKGSDRHPDLPVDFDWRKKYKECNTYIGNSKRAIDLEWLPGEFDAVFEMQNSFATFID